MVWKFKMKLTVREIQHGSDQYDLEVRLRSKVLREPLGLHFSADELLREKGDVHIGAFDGDRLVGCLLLTHLDSRTLKMRQVAVDENFQRQGIGRLLVDASEKKSQQLKISQLVLHARESAVLFYLKLGYEIFAEPFVEVGIPHRKMRKFFA